MGTEDGGKKPLTVLIVDDDPAIVRAVGFRLTHAGYRPLLANNGVDGLALARSDCPDAIILDLRMPGLDGLAVLKHLQDCQETVEIPAIILSADAADRARLNALRSGATYFVEKPYKAETLILALSNALAARKHAHPAAEPAGA